jgi:hypothetical protein
MKKLSVILGVFAFVMLLSSAVQAAGDEGDLLGKFSTPDAAVAPLTPAELDEVRGEGTMEFTFSFPQLRRDFDKIFTFDTTSIHVIGDATAGTIWVEIDSPYIQ